jgi:hypothetical protein
MENKQLAQGIASLGRYGDTTLMHMRPDEVNQLTAISRANGGDITINPDTGMPEAFLGNFISALAPTAAGIAAGAFFPPAYAPYLAAGAGGLTAYAQGKRDPLGIAMGALGGYGGGTLGQNLAATGGVQVPAGSAESTFMPTDTTIGGANLTSNVAGATGTTGTTGQIGGANLSTAGARGITATTPTQVYKPINTGFGPNMGQVNNPFATPRDVALDNEAFYQIGSPTNQLPDIQPDPNAITKLPPLQEGRPGLFEQGYEYAQNKFGQLGRGVEGVFTDSNKRAEFFGRMGGAQYDEAGNLIKAGSEGAGMLKTALPFAGAGLEAYQKGMYENMPTYEASTAGRYDPTRTLNLGMDTGLRLLAKGGSVKRYQMGGNIMGNASPTYALGSPFMQYPQGGPPPEYGIVDVGGNFVKTSDKPGEGLMSKTDYYQAYKFKEPGYTAEANKEQGDGGDFEARAGMQGGAGGINPAVALQAAQGYAESQQSNLDEQGLGTLKTGGSVRRFQMGGTTAERNMYGSQDTNEPTGLGTLTTAEQNLPGRMGMAGRADLQNATTAEQNIAREPMQEAGTVVTQQMGNDLAARAGETFSRLPVIPGDANNNMAKILGVALQSNPGAFTVVPNETIPPTGAPTTSLNLNTGRQEPMAMGGRVRYAEGGISALTPDDGKMLNGNGDGVSDDIPAMIEGEQEAALSDGEFIVPARIVSELGNGSSDAGAQKLYEMIDRIQAVRKQTMGDNKQYAKDTNAERFLPV